MLHELDRRIDNHFTVDVPGHDDRYLILPFGLHWSEARAKRYDRLRRVTARRSRAKAWWSCRRNASTRRSTASVARASSLHTHQPWALALNMLEDNRLLPANQTAAYFHGRIAYDDHYAGTADSLEERRASRR